MADWSYGDSWERYPIKAGEIWTETGARSVVAVADLFDGLPGYMTDADMIYIDPPWNTGNIRSFYTKAGLTLGGNFRDFSEVLLSHIAAIGAQVCYMEMGKQNVIAVEESLARLYPVVQAWHVTYYRRNPSFLLRAGRQPTDVDFTGMDDADTPRLALES